MRHCVILAGGGGTRLWPASRRSKPKQFLSLGAKSGESLLAATARRLAPLCPDNLYVVTAKEQVRQVAEDLPQMSAANIIAEPSARNTAAALGLAAIHLLHRDPDAIMGAIPADQHIAQEAEFRRVVEHAFEAAETHDAIITLGIVPTHPETGFGYLKIGKSIDGELRTVDAFVEKPDKKKAQAYLQSGNYLWNGGMFFTKAARLLSEIKKHMPATGEGLEQIANALKEGGSEERCQELYPQLESISIDYGVMEKTNPVLTIAGDFGWNDVGSWTALAQTSPTDSQGNVIIGEHILMDASNNIIVSDDQNMIALAGVHNMIVIKSGNVIMILPKDRSQEVRSLVEALRKQKRDDYL